MAVFVAIFAGAPLTSRGASPSAPLGWQTLRFGDSPEVAADKLHRLYPGKEWGLSVKVTPSEQTVSGVTVKSKVVYATLARSPFPEFSRTGRLRTDGLRAPHIKLTFAAERLYQIEVLATYGVEASNENGERARPLAYEMKNLYGKSLPNLTFQDASQAPLLQRGELFRAGSILECSFDGGHVQYSSEYLNISEPVIGLALDMYSDEGAAIIASFKQDAERHRRSEEAYEKAWESAFSFSLVPKLSGDVMRIVNRTSFDYSYAVNCRRTAPSTYRCTWEDVGVSGGRTPNPILSGNYKYEKNSYQQFELKKTLKEADSYDGVRVVFHKAIGFDLKKKTDSYNALIEFSSLGSRAFEVWLSGDGNSPRRE